jgi:hypothetical protein
VEDARRRSGRELGHGRGTSHRLTTAPNCRSREINSLTMSKLAWISNQLTNCSQSYCR